MTKLGQASATTKAQFFTGPVMDNVKYQRTATQWAYKSSVPGPEIIPAPPG